MDLHIDIAAFSDLHFEHWVVVVHTSQHGHTSFNAQFSAKLLLQDIVGAFMGLNSG